MSSSNLGRVVPAGLTAVVIAAVASACGSGSSQSPTTPSAQTALSQADLGRVTNAIGLGLSSAFVALSSGVSSQSVNDTRVTPLATDPHVLPVNMDTPCPGGGTVDIIGTVSGSVFSTAGEITMSEQIAFTNCLVNGVLLQGNPNLVLTTHMNVVDSKVVTPFVTAITGSVLFTYNGTQGSVVYSCTSTFDISTGPSSSSSTGTIVIESPIGSTPRTLSCSGA